jgi:hypothetical protein
MVLMRAVLELNLNICEWKRTLRISSMFPKFCMVHYSIYCQGENQFNLIFNNSIKYCGYIL